MAAWAPTLLGGVTQTTNGTIGLTFGRTYHAVFAIANGGPIDQNSQIYVDGVAIPVTRTNTLSQRRNGPPAGNLTGNIPILATDELTIGEPAGSAQNPFLGRWGGSPSTPTRSAAAQAAANSACSSIRPWRWAWATRRRPEHQPRPGGGAIHVGARDRSTLRTTSSSSTSTSPAARSTPTVTRLPPGCRR